MAYTPQPGMKDALMGKGINLATDAALQIGRITAIDQTTLTATVVLLQGGTLYNVQIAGPYAGRHVGTLNYPPITAGNNTSTATGEHDTYALIGYIQGNSLMPIIIGMLYPQQPDIQAIPDQTAATLHEGDITLHFDNGAMVYLSPFVQLTINSVDNLVSSIDPSLIPELVQGMLKIELADGKALTIDSEGFHVIGGLTVDNVDITDHASLTNLDYADSGHTGFAPEQHEHSQYALVNHSHPEYEPQPSRSFGNPVADDSLLNSSFVGVDGELRLALNSNTLYRCEVKTTPDDQILYSWQPLPYLDETAIDLKVVDDKQAPHDLVNFTTSWDSLAPSPDLLIQWQPLPDAPADFDGYLVTVTNDRQEQVLSVGLNRYTSQCLVNYATYYPTMTARMFVLIQTRDVFGNISEGITTGVEYPTLDQPQAPTIREGYRVALIEVDNANQASLGVEISALLNSAASSDNQLTVKSLPVGQTTTQFYANSGESITIQYRYRDPFGRDTVWSLPVTTVLPTGMLNQADLASLEQVIISSNGTQTTEELNLLIDGIAQGASVSFVDGNILEIAYPLARPILGLLLYGTAADTASISVRYANANGLIIGYGCNDPSTDSTIAGSAHDWLLRKYTGVDFPIDIHADIPLEAVGSSFFKELRFGDSAVAASRQQAAITAQRLYIQFHGPIDLTELRVLTYEAAQLLFARKMFLSEGVEISNDDGATGFTLDTNKFRAYQAGDDTVVINNNGQLWAIRGGFGGTELVPTITLTDDGMESGTVKWNQQGFFVKADSAINYNERGFIIIDPAGNIIGQFLGTADTNANEIGIAVQDVGTLTAGDTIRLRNIIDIANAGIKMYQEQVIGNGTFTATHSINYDPANLTSVIEFLATVDSSIANGKINLRIDDSDVVHLDIVSDQITYNGVAVSFPVGDEAHGAGTLSAASANNTANPHTHAITASDAPGAAASLLKTSPTGKLTLASLETADFAIGSNVLTAGTSGQIALGAGGLSASSVQNAGINNHTHAVSASAAPGAAESLLKTTPAGKLTLASLEATAFAIGANALTVGTAGQIALGAGGLSATSVQNAGINNHTHAITASATPGSSESLLKTSPVGKLTLASLEATAFAIGPNALTVGTAGQIALGAGGLSATSVQNAGINNHTHAISASSAPGIAESLLKTTSNGDLTIAGDLAATNLTNFGGSSFPANSAANDGKQRYHKGFRAWFQYIHAITTWQQVSVGEFTNAEGFPASPVNNLRAFKDGLEWQYNSTAAAWISTKLESPVIAFIAILGGTGYTTGLISGTTQGTANATHNYSIHNRAYRVRVDEIYITSNPGATNNTSNYWGYDVVYVPLGGAATSLFSATTQNDTAGVAAIKTMSSPSSILAVNANGGVIQFKLWRVGTPGTLFCNPFIAYRLVHP